ncbi:MAG: DUF3173 domain-containing protein [Clostridia bacterium]
MKTITKKDLVALGYGPGQAVNIIKQAKDVMVGKGFGYYKNPRLGRVPVEVVEEILGIEIN